MDLLKVWTSPRRDSPSEKAQAEVDTRIGSEDLRRAGGQLTSFDCEKSWREVIRNLKLQSSEDAGEVDCGRPSRHTIVVLNMASA